ncbi:hypothetical protein TNCT_311 [Trichonephila clavata]|uniref:Pre-C2HC domain-containing protein n=1 Tax=Trichonephila clavata TaxID=2740835 RepID=A0A8X6KMS2_TRICU|nr:hypothetical protein TNCT_311 [Trichonephila clavata]
MPPKEIISDLGVQGFHIEEYHNMVSRKSGEPMPLFMLSMERSEKHKTIFSTITSIGYVKVIVEVLWKKYGSPQCFRCQGFFHSTEKEKKKQQQQRSVHVVPEPPKVNFWEQRANTVAQSQQPTASTRPRPSTAPSPPSKPVNSQDSPTDLFDQLRNPAVQDTFDLLKRFIEIATTIPTKYRHLRTIRQLLGEEIQI